MNVRCDSAISTYRADGPDDARNEQAVGEIAAPPGTMRAPVRDARQRQQLALKIKPDNNQCVPNETGITPRERDVIGYVKFPARVVRQKKTKLRDVRVFTYSSTTIPAPQIYLIKGGEGCFGLDR